MRSPAVSIPHAELSGYGARGFSKSASKAWTNSLARVAPGLFPPGVTVRAKAPACELPSKFGAAFSRQYRRLGGKVAAKSHPYGLGRAGSPTPVDQDSQCCQERRRPPLQKEFVRQNFGPRYPEIAPSGKRPGASVCRRGARGQNPSALGRIVLQATSHGEP